MWNLKKGRNKFLNRYGFDDTHSVWWHVSRALADASDPHRRADILSDLADYEKKHHDNLYWSPTSSNCPSYAAVVEDVKDNLAPEWRALANNIFVGITLTSDVNAKAWNHESAGVIEISLQYLWALEAYASAFDEFAFALASKLHHEVEPHFARKSPGIKPDDYGNIRNIWKRLDEGVLGWRRTDAIEAGSPDLVRIRPGRRQREFDRYQQSAQEFIVCHEIAHHILTHTAKTARARGREARNLIDPHLGETVVGILGEFSTNSREEIEADLLAVAIMAGKFRDNAERGMAYRAIAGCALALTTTTHVNEHWLDYDPTHTHPPLALRLAVIFAAFDAWFADMPIGERGDHPLDYLLQWKVFTDALLTHWLGTQQAEIDQLNAQLSDDEYLNAIVSRFLAGREHRHNPASGSPEEI